MKTKAIILIAVSAIVTLSFTFASVKSTDKKVVSTTETSAKASDAPAGGFVSEDKF